MAYRDEIEVVLGENEEIRRALAKARADARFTALRQVLLAFAFGLSWSVLDAPANADVPPTVVQCAPMRPIPVVRRGALQDEHPQGFHDHDVGDDEDEDEGEEGRAR